MNFINKNQFQTLEKDPIENYHKQKQHTLQKCSKQHRKYLNQPPQTAPNLRQG